MALYMVFFPSEINEMFDLDMALTMPEDPRTQQLDAESRVSAAEELISGMPTVADGGGGQCSVCFEKFGSGVGGKQIPCGHLFHSNCISHWVSLHDSCPICRSSVSVSVSSSPSAKFIL